MDTKNINGIEHVKESDYLGAEGDVQINHLLVDIQDKKIITI